MTAPLAEEATMWSKVLNWAVAKNTDTQTIRQSCGDTVAPYTLFLICCW